MGDSETERQTDSALLDGSLALFISNAPVQVAMFDREMRYLAWSQEWANYLGIQSENLAHRSHYEIFPDLPDRWRDIHRRAFQGESINCDEDTFQQLDGQQVWLRWRVRPIRDSGGAVFAIVIFSEDITDRKRTEAKLRNAADRLQQITKSLGIGVFEHDFATDQSMISDSFMDLLRIRREQVPVTTDGWTALLRPVDLAAYLEARQRALDPAGDGRFSWEVHPIVEGVERVMEFQSRVLFSEAGAERKPERMVGLIVDQTESRRLQEALSRAQRLETVGRLAGMVAHDFNNILTVIMANLELAELRTVYGDVRRLMRNAIDAAEMGAGFTKRLLALAGGHPFKGEPIVIDEHIGKVWDVFQRVLSDEIVFRFHPGAHGALVQVDPAEIDGAILNLVMNARDAQTGGGQIDLHTEVVTLGAAVGGVQKPGRHLRISVRDNGPGMSEEVAARVGEPFFTTKAPGRGSGLGLTSVTLTAERAGGFLKVLTTPGDGTDVSIYLPVLGESARASVAETKGYPFGNGELVLVVEDDPMVREATLLRLEAIGYAVIEAGNADAALSLIDSGEPVDLVFSDVIMPGTRSGYDLMRELRARHPSIALLLTSGHVSAVMRARDGIAPPVPLLSKPYPLKVLADAVAEALRQVQESA